MNNFINLNRPSFFLKEKKFLNECINSGWISTSGNFVNDFEKKISKFTGSKYAIACSSGTSALQIALNVCGVDNDDEVIIPTITFIAPVNAIKYNGAYPVFIDVDDNFNLDINKLIIFLKKETFFKNGFTYNKKTKRIIKAILPVHVWGNAVDLEPILKIMKQKNIKIIEDASESLGTSYLTGKIKNKHTGTIGNVGIFSFNANKIITTGGGGMILTNNKKIAKKAFYLTNQAKDDPINFIHNEIGYNFRMSNLHAAIGLAQIENIDKILKKKKNINLTYSKLYNSHDKLQILKAPSYSNSNYWMNILKFDKFNKIRMNEIVSFFKKNSIEIRPVWHPNHLQKPYKNCQKFKIDNAIGLVNNSICLPSSFNLKYSDIKKIYNVTLKYLNNI